MEILIGFWFWFVVVLIIGGIIYEIEQDNGVGTTAVAIIGGLCIWYFSGGNNPLPWLSRHWGEILACIVAYVLIGACWGVIKWWFFLLCKADEYENRRAVYQSDWTNLTDAVKARYGDYKGYVLSEGYPPSIAKHKADYIMWMTWWPFSALWTLLNDPIKRISRIIYQNLSAMMGRMSAAVFAGRFTELK